MNRDLRRTLLLVGLCVCFGCLILLSNWNYRLGEGILGQGKSPVTVLDSPPETALTVSSQQQKNALVLFSPGHEDSEKYADNLCIVLDHLRFNADLLPVAQIKSQNIWNYDLIIMASSYWEEELQISATFWVDYVEQGGRFLLGILPAETGSQFRSIYRQLGIVDYGEYIETRALFFEKDLIPGIADREFLGEEFVDVLLACTLEDSAQVYAWGKTEQELEYSVPLFWTFDLGKGRIGVFNGTGIQGDYWRGIAAGCVNAMFDTVMYPIINAGCIFIDDFPSPLYEADYDLFREEYNRTLQEFYRDIWWADMLQMSHIYHDQYTCLYVTSYDNEVEQENFSHTETRMELYFGNSLLQNGYEMGMHGYNHQPLTFEGGTPEELNYNGWGSAEDMRSAVREYFDIAEAVFPAVRFQTYVPPSNYLSEAGRAVLVEEVPDLKIISGVYTAEGESGEVYVQNFEMARDGIAEFPRVTSGMILSDYDTLCAVSAMGLHGVFSHFIHPDDILDPERSKDQDWKTMRDSYSAFLKDIHTTYPFLRSLVASDAADALKVADSAQPYLDISEEQILGSIEGFLGDTYFYLKTDKIPESVDSSCTIGKACSVKDSDYYLVTVKSPNFTIKLVNP